MVPADNVRNLVLSDEVVDAVRDGKFHIYAVSNVDEGIEVLSGVPAGKRREDGTYPEGTVHALVEKRLEEMAQKARALRSDAGAPAKGADDNDEGEPSPAETGTR